MRDDAADETADETYVAVRGRVKLVREKSILFTVGESVERGGWVPRKLIHGADERTLDGCFANEERTIRIFAWKARELGFEPDHELGAAEHDLFGED